jgi:hypothetical protein
MAVDFFVSTLGFELAEVAPALTSDGEAKQWVAVRSRGAQTGVLLTRADSGRQCERVGQQVAERGRMLGAGRGLC